MASTNRIDKLIDGVMTKYSTILNKPANFTSIAKINAAYREAQKQLLKVLALSDKYFDSLKLDDIYKKVYNKWAKVLGIKASPLPSGAGAAKKDFRRAMKEMTKMAQFNLEERMRMAKSFVKSQTNGLAAAAKAKGNKAEIKKIAQKYADRFRPTTGVANFRNEYYGIAAGTNRKEFIKTWSKSWDKLSRKMTRIMRKGIEGGAHKREIVEEMLGAMEERFPTVTKNVAGKLVKSSTFPIPVKSADGTVHIRRIGQKYYAEMKAGYYSQSMDTQATIDIMNEAGTDLVEYNVHGPQEHTEICLELSDGGAGKIYSLSGKSENYPLLEIYPPAHYNCHSTIDPLPIDQQESVDQTKKEKKDTEKRVESTPQEKAEVFDELEDVEILERAEEEGL
jgi:hypothetical protein